MRMRKKKWVTPFIEEENRYVIKNAQDIKTFIAENDYKKIYLEVGMGMGDFITGSANRDKDTLYIGFEKIDTCVAKSAIKASELNLENFKVILDTADNICDYFDHNVDRIYLHFSDPWPKKAHAKRRLTYHTYLEKYVKVLKDDGDIFFKTDNKDLFEFSIVEMTNFPLKLVDFSVDYHRFPNDDIKTGYEEKFSSLGQPIYHALFKKVL